MLICLISLFILIIGIIFICLFYNNDILIGMGCALTGIGFVLTSVCIPMIMASRLSISADIRAYPKMQQTLNIARKEHRTYELATIGEKIIRTNTHIATYKYYTKNLWTSWFVPKEILKVHYIK